MKARKAKVDAWTNQGRPESVDQLRAERDRGVVRIKSYGGESNIKLVWGQNLNEDCQRDQICEIQIGGKKALVNSEEMQRFLRWI